MPTENLFLVDPLEKDMKTSSGIYIPGKTREAPQSGRVIEAGKNKLGIKKDDIIIFKRFEATRYKAGISGKNYLFIEASSVLAVKEEEKNEKKIKSKKIYWGNWHIFDCDICYEMERRGYYEIKTSKDHEDIYWDDFFAKPKTLRPIKYKLVKVTKKLDR